MVFEKLTFVITMIDTIISITNIVPNINFFLSVSLHAMFLIPRNKVGISLGRLLCSLSLNDFQFLVSRIILYSLHNTYAELQMFTHN